MQLFLGAIFPPFSTRNTLLPPLPVFEAVQTTCSAKAATVGPQTTPRGEEHEDTKLTINFLSLELFFSYTEFLSNSLQYFQDWMLQTSVGQKLILKDCEITGGQFFRSLHNPSIKNLWFVLPSSLSKGCSPHPSQGLSYPSCTTIYVYDTTQQGVWEHTMQSQAVLHLGNIRKKRNQT